MIGLPPLERALPNKQNSARVCGASRDDLGDLDVGARHAIQDRVASMDRLALPP
jgi:hypothetical protein